MHRILLVDDDEGIRTVMRAILEEERFEIEEARDGEEALRRARELPPDLVFLDLMMPGLDGFSVLAELKADERTAGCPVVVVSAMGKGSRQRALESGAAAYFEKPFSPLALLEVVERLLAPRAAGP